MWSCGAREPLQSPLETQILCRPYGCSLVSTHLILLAFTVPFLLVILQKRIVSQFAVVLVITRAVVVATLRTSILLFRNAFACANAVMDLTGLLTAIFMALARGLFDLFHLRLALCSQSGYASLFGVAVRFEEGPLFFVGWTAAIEDGAFAVTDSLFLDAAFHVLILISVAESLIAVVIVRASLNTVLTLSFHQNAVAGDGVQPYEGS